MAKARRSRGKDQAGPTPAPRRLPRLAPRRDDAHKGDFGRALLVGGSRGMAGAIALAGMACLRSGAGLVKLAVPACCLDTIAGFEPSYMTVPLDGDEAGRIAGRAVDRVVELAHEATCVALGPGLGQSRDLATLVGRLYQSLPVPLVVDADGLNALVRHGGIGHQGHPRVLTPHPGEFARLFGVEAQDREAQIQAARQIARKENVVILLKGHRTFITDGTRQAVNTTGNPGMATGGSGDVLTGIITALVCQGLPAFEAALLGAHVHGLAGDLAAEELGQVSLIASDLLDYLPRAFRRV
jgi:NAD(P)H-hydrate epimerase